MKQHIVKSSINKNKELKIQVRLSQGHKRIIMDSNHLLRHCKGIDTEKLHKCNIERMGDKFIFEETSKTTRILSL